MDTITYHPENRRRCQSGSSEGNSLLPASCSEAGQRDIPAFFSRIKRRLIEYQSSPTAGLCSFSPTNRENNMKRHILKKVGKLSVVVLLALSLLVIDTTTPAAALSVSTSHTSTQFAPACQFHQTNAYSVAVVIAYATCFFGTPVSVTAYASTHVPASDCSTVSNVTSTIWGYYNGSYRVLARGSVNNNGCFGTGEQVPAQCGVIYHARPKSADGGGQVRLGTPPQTRMPSVSVNTVTET